jgi:hypothetical protein
VGENYHGPVSLDLESLAIVGVRFVPKSLSSITFESNSHLARMKPETLTFSFFQSILIPCSVEILGSKCFSDCKSLSPITFASTSHLTRIEWETFSSSSIQSIMIPRNFEIIRWGCFQDCKSFSSISFESNSRLRRIESQGFHDLGIDIVIVIPSTVLFVAFDAISNLSNIFISDRDSCPEFDRWRQLRKSGIAIDFRWILRVGSGLRDLNDDRINLCLMKDHCFVISIKFHIKSINDRMMV